VCRVSIVERTDSWHAPEINRYNRRAEQRGQQVKIELDATRLGDITHIERQHYRHPEFAQLHGQIEVALQVRGVDHIDQDIRLLVDDEIAGNHLLDRIGGQTVRSGQVHNLELPFPVPAGAFLLLYRHPGIITDMLAATGHGIEKRGLA
jgi:hypothetical protein